MSIIIEELQLTHGNSKIRLLEANFGLLKTNPSVNSNVLLFKINWKTTYLKDKVSFTFVNFSCKKEELSKLNVLNNKQLSAELKQVD